MRLLIVRPAERIAGARDFLRKIRMFTGDLRDARDADWLVTTWLQAGTGGRKWKATTMRKKLGRSELLAVFEQLETEDKIRVFENCCGTVSTSYDVMREEFAKRKSKKFVGFAYFTIQSTASAFQDGVLCLGFGVRDFDDVSPSGIEATIKVGHIIVARLTAAGFKAKFDNPIMVKVPKAALPDLPEGWE